MSKVVIAVALCVGCNSTLLEGDLESKAAEAARVDSGNPADDIPNTDDPITDSGQPSPEDTADPDPVDPETIDYRYAGPYSTSVSSLSLSASCTSSVEITSPTSAGSWPRIILAHGFMRAAVNMEGWAEHLASWGFEVVRPALCHATILDTDHRENGADLVQWNAALGGGPVIYAGQSAGGLAALIAAGSDPESVGVIGLDLTDADGIGVSQAASVDAPTFGLVGISSSCNSENNGIAALSGVSGSSLVRITDADHCDFENESDWLCTSFCENAAASVSDAQIRTTVLGLLASAAASASGMDPDAKSMWWQPGGAFYDVLLGDNALSPL